MKTYKEFKKDWENHPRITSDLEFIIELTPEEQEQEKTEEERFARQAYNEYVLKQYYPSFELANCNLSREYFTTRSGVYSKNIILTNAVLSQELKIMYYGVNDMYVVTIGQHNSEVIDFHGLNRWVYKRTVYQHRNYKTVTDWFGWVDGCISCFIDCCLKEIDVCDKELIRTILADAIKPRVEKLFDMYPVYDED